MNIKQRKKETLKKLDYLGYNERQKKLALKTNYSLSKIINKEYLDFEERVDRYYNLVRSNEKVNKIEKMVEKTTNVLKD